MKDAGHTGAQRMLGKLEEEVTSAEQKNMGEKNCRSEELYGEPIPSLTRK